MYRNILVSVDLGNAEGEALTIAAAVAQARAFGATLHVMTVVPDYSGTIVGSFFPRGYEKEAMALADQTLAEFTSQHVGDDVAHRRFVGNGVVYRQILQQAEAVDADLIVISAGRDGPDDYLIGPNATRVVRHAKSSVLVVRKEA